MGHIPEDVIAQIIERSDIVEIIGEYLPLKPAGRNFKAFSPFTTEKTASFIVSPEKQIFHCFSTGKGGNVISFVMQQERMNFPEAVRFLARKASIVIPETESTPQQQEAAQIRDKVYAINGVAVEFFHQQLLTGKDDATVAARDYMQARGISLEMVKDFKLGFAPDKWDGLLDALRAKKYNEKFIEEAGLILSRRDGSGFYDRFRNRVMFPIFDYRGQPVAFGGRTLDPDDGAKYINSPDTPVYTKGRHLYGFHLSKSDVGKVDEVVVVEGYTDFIIPFQAGAKHCVASLGTALTVDQIRLLRRYTRNIIMLFDTDKAGQAAMLRSIDILIEEEMSVKIAQLDDGEDPDSFVRQNGVDAFNERCRNGIDIFDFKLNALLKEFNAQTVEGRAKVCSAMLPTIMRYKNEVMKTDYIRRLARELGISEQAVVTESQKTSTSSITPTEAPVESISPKELLRLPEGQLLQLTLAEPQVLKEITEQLILDDIEHLTLRKIFTQLFMLFRAGEAINVATLLESVDDEIAHSLVTGIIANTDEKQDERFVRKVLKDCIYRLVSKRTQREKQQLIDQIRVAERQGDQQQVEMLQQQFNQLLKR